MTTFFGADNMTDDSAMAFVHDNADNAERTSGHQLGPGLHVVRQDLSRDATRDMLVFFTRTPVVKGHVSYGVVGKAIVDVCMWELVDVEINCCGGGVAGSIR